MAQVKFPFFVQRAIRLTAELMFSDKWDNVLMDPGVSRTYDKQERLPRTTVSNFAIAKVTWRTFERTGEREVTIFDADSRNNIQVTLVKDGRRWRILTLLITFRAENDGKQLGFYLGNFHQAALAAM